jgi:hypothetical protein
MSESKATNLRSPFAKVLTPLYFLDSSKWRFIPHNNKYKLFGGYTVHNFASKPISYYMQCFSVLLLQANTFLRLQFLPQEKVGMSGLLRPS